MKPTFNQFQKAIKQHALLIFTNNKTNIFDQALDKIANTCQFDRKYINRFKQHLTLNFIGTDDVDNEHYDIYSVKLK